MLHRDEPEPIATNTEGQGRGPGASLGPASVAFETGRRSARSRTWVGIAANAGAGAGRGRARVSRLVRELRRRDIRSRIAWTPEERVALVGEAADDRRARCVVAVGGDGTVAALINDCPTVPISVLPSGTENLFARNFRLGPNPRRLAEAIADGTTYTCDLGVARGRRFSLMAGLGFDADVVTRHHIARVGATGKVRPTNRVAYVDPVLRSSLGYRFPEMRVRLVGEGGEEETLRGSTIFVFNLPRYALGLPFAPTARGDDGLLDLVVFRKPGAFHALHYLWLVLRKLHLRRDDVEHRKVRHVEITGVDRIPVQLDGDPGGFIEDGASLTVDALPAAIQVIVPPGQM